ncbi:MAG: tRNA (adenosine(37)-N6)-threonylcarbamoyltransferase complex dimerization subunit type 1 TsaB [Gammaproteobacteria bacterium]|jgi:tRNA threonylcarbamoyladenosine biosynthesis protein TsaB|uniref:tRNA threonylcarbamoyladenosine biosynthesis protein TsaB n=1 Tax=Marinomonas polaris DSM 16579 TaxID=1122206 RepID=A0A1M5C2J4_9GAMM|nr:MULTISPECIES: tRNA (adenosine(37)-N6)-threonylcarbamoyltransferase complex dimerization subunit type 1 TsaB [Marinomonas]MBU1294538.1 tRNA (adenosine(37)-N6)-threonylcarbamoyltransferase complex dimerization subunit type 1 TsaB [Gammaproteobacteria bacterium]MBU1465185.1 tRNA (adenosine(37)-N6)-threonylcarbamoyltransferase complex dimerization subunit type 1 TsaB [Gammaproteobacteria bacterium]MBU2022002.1 tRNA (adenosine(37)-N6)-threonylcarbamoyltransferase complex dimerization subunit type |tara:strand:+ start:177175 stop:177882 length:708 start_codon:yes stop_codon:yes gene_type:complete
MTVILALDTSTPACSVALNIDGVVLEDFRMAPRLHNDLILPMVDQILSQAGLALSDLDAIAFGRGPGSFTGLRISAGVVQGLAFGADLPVIPVSTLAALSLEGFQKTGKNNWLAALDARMGEIYMGGYSVNKIEGCYEIDSLIDECVVKPAALSAFSTSFDGVGSGWCYEDVLTPLLPSHPTHILTDLAPRAACIAELALLLFKKGEMVSAYDAIPTYLRDEISWEKQAPRIGKR